MNPYKRNFSKLFPVFFLLTCSANLFGQSIDTTQVFPLDSFLNWVREYHPVMRQAGLLQNRADASLMESRGTFDPKIYGDYEDKAFDQKNYFRIGETGLKIPTWFGADVKLAYAWTSGIFLNPENNLPVDGQAIAGIELPLGQGLFFDERRAQVRQAQLLEKANEIDRRVITNNLLLSAVEHYWEWAYQYQVVKIFDDALNLSQNRFILVRESFFQGDVPAIDTLEAIIQVQNRSFELQQANVDYETATLALSNFLWYKNMIPLEITGSLKPEDLPTEWILSPDFQLGEALISLDNTHPDLQALQIKQQQLDIKERLKREYLKPKIDVNYNFLADAFDFTDDNSEDGSVNTLLTQNYKWGVNISYPIFLRKARGGLELVQVEQLETNYKFQEKRLDLQNKINAAVQQIKTTFEQIDTQRDILVNYQRLLDAELEKFRIGESSIFLLNSREQKLVETELKLAKLESEYQKLQRKLDWARGQLL